MPFPNGIIDPGGPNIEAVLVKLGPNELDVD
jgi:hypothetical protein